MKKRLPWQLPILIVCIMLSIGLGLKVVLMAHYTIEDGNVVYDVYTIHHRVDRILELSKVTIESYDKLSHGLEDKLKKNERVVIERAKQVTIQTGEHLQTVYTTGKRVADILMDANIVLTDLDRVRPGLKAPVTAGEVIYLDRVQKEHSEKVLETTAPILYKVSSELEAGTTKLVSDGSSGQRIVKINEYMENGQWFQSEIVGESQISLPTSRVYQLGKENLFVTPTGAPYAVKAVYTMQATAYDLSFESCGKYPDHPLYGITRSGTHARPGVVAVDPKVVPLGSVLYVESLDYTRDYGFSSAEDTGGAIKGNRIDLFIGDNSSARRYGRRNVRVYVLDEKVEDHLIVGYGK